MIVLLPTPDKAQAKHEQVWSISQIPGNGAMMPPTP